VSPGLGDLLVRLAVDVTAITIFAVLIFFRRHAKPSLTAVFVFFNIGLFAVVAAITTGPQLNSGVGFGLFAMLSIIRLRSDPFSPREIAYFFGALVLGLVNGLASPSGFSIALNVGLVGAMFILDHPRLFFVAPSLTVTFDRVIADEVELKQALEQRLGLRIGEVSVSSVDYVRDLMELKVQYLPAGGLPPRSAKPSARSARHDLVRRLPKADPPDRVSPDEKVTSWPIQ